MKVGGMLTEALLISAVILLGFIYLGERLMGALDDLNTGLGRVSAGLDSVGTEIRKIATQLANSPTEAQVAEAAASANALADRVEQSARDVDALIEVPGEDDVIEPPVDPTVPEVEGNPNHSA